MSRRVPLPFRRPASLGLALAAAAILLAAPAARAAQPDGTLVVTVLGDSLTAGLGLPAQDAIPARLEAELRRRGLKATVRAAGVSGDTSADGLARADFSVKPDTDLCVVALGGNDLLQGVEPKVLKANLEAILRKLKARRIRALLVGVKAPRTIGEGYAREFDAVVPAVAKAAGVPAVPDLLGPVALDRRLNQGDGIHPNAEGARQVAARLAPTAAAALRSTR
jgi:acyl-CoA thioesterase-1